MYKDTLFFRSSDDSKYGSDISSLPYCNSNLILTYEKLFNQVYLQGLCQTYSSTSLIFSILTGWTGMSRSFVWTEAILSITSIPWMVSPYTV